MKLYIPTGRVVQKVLFSILMAGLVMACDIKKNKEETDPTRTLIKIYENNDLTQSFIPLDIKQTSDGGYIYLAKRRIPESSFFGIYVMKADALGNFVSEQMLAPDFVNPVGHLMKSGTLYYFFAMNGLTLDTRLMTVDENGSVTEAASIAGIVYPLYASADELTGQFLLQHYNRDAKKTVISRINSSGAITAQREFDIGFGDFDIEEPVIDHLTGTGKRLPFLTGTVGGGIYFFNGFSNYTLSTVFFSFGNSNPGVLQGYKDERCISAALYLRDNNKFAVSRYAYGETYISPNAVIDYASGSVASNSDLPGYLMLEFSPDAKVELHKIQVRDRKILVFNTDTRSKQIGLYFYDESSGAFLGAKYFGYSNPYEAGSLTATSDGGLAIIGTTYLAGRFPRIALIKISKEELEEVVK